MKRINFLIIIILLLGCTNNKKNAENEVSITVNTNQIINKMQGGFGASMHAIEDSITVSTIYKGKYRSWGGSVWGANPPLDDEVAWQKTFELSDWLGLDWCRVEIEHQMFKPEKEVFDTTCYEMKVLYKWLDYCQNNNIDVLLQEMWPNVEWLAHESFRDDPVELLRSAPNDFEAWADGIGQLLDFLVKDKNYTCIKWFSIANEPMEHWSWWKAKDGSPQDILPGLIAVKNEIDERKLPVQIAAPDFPMKYTHKGLDQHTIECCKYAGAYSFHDYAAKPDWWDKKPPILHSVQSLNDWKKQAVKDGNKPLFVAEFGTFMYGILKDTDGPSRYLSLIRDVQYVIRTSQVGVDAFNRWSLINRGDLDGQWQLIDTWDTKRFKPLPAEKIVPHKNSFNMYGLLPRFTAKYSEVIKTEVSGGKDTITIADLYERTDTLIRHVFASAFRCPKSGNYSVFINNDDKKPYPTLLKFDGLEKSKKLFYYYEVTEKDEDKEGIFIVPIREEMVKSGKISLILPPMSVVVLSNFKLNKSDKGIR
jgi:hypothetical protein